MENNTNEYMGEAVQAVEVKPKKQKKKRTKKVIILDIIIVILIIAIAICGYKLGAYYLGNMKQEKEFDKLRVTKEETEAQRKARYEKLHAENQDFVAWLTVKGAGVDYPVMQTKNDFEYYLHKNFKKEYSLKGTPFMSPSSTTDPTSMYTLIFGHHMQDGSMFGGLMRYKDQDFYKDHKTIRLDMLKYTADYDIFAAVLTNATGDDNKFPVYAFDYMGGTDYYNDFIAQIKAKSLIKTDITPKDDQKLIALSTCEYSQKNGRFVLFGVLKSEREYKND